MGLQLVSHDKKAIEKSDNLGGSSPLPRGTENRKQRNNIHTVRSYSIIKQKLSPESKLKNKKRNKMKTSFEPYNVLGGKSYLSIYTIRIHNN